MFEQSLTVNNLKSFRGKINYFIAGCWKLSTFILMRGVEFSPFLFGILFSQNGRIIMRIWRSLIILQCRIMLNAFKANVCAYRRTKLTSMQNEVLFFGKCLLRDFGLFRCC
jgi:hypothetical protein